MYGAVSTMDLHSNLNILLESSGCIDYRSIDSFVHINDNFMDKPVHNPDSLELSHNNSTMDANCLFLLEGELEVKVKVKVKSNLKFEVCFRFMLLRYYTFNSSQESYLSCSKNWLPPFNCTC